MSKHTYQRLAIDGGVPAISTPLPHTMPGGFRIGSDEEQAVIEVLRGKNLNRYGDADKPSRSQQLETAFAHAFGVKHCIAVSSGTAALQCAMAAVGVGPGDEVIVPAYTWIATPGAALFAGALPVVAEIDASLTLDPADVERKITPRTKAIAAVHMRGGPCNMDALLDIATRHGLKLIEDTAQAVGATYRGARLGTLGDVGAYSLQFSKIITSGEGGLLCTNDEALWKRVLMYHDVVGGMHYGLSDAEMLPGVSMRLSELHSAVALAQLGKLEPILADLRRNRAVLKAGIADVVKRAGLNLRAEPDPAGDAGVCLVVFMPDAATAAHTVDALDAEGAKAFQIYSGERDYHVYCEWTPLVNKRSWLPDNAPWRHDASAQTLNQELCPQSIDLLSRAVHIDISPDLTSEQVEELTDAVNKVLAAVS
jgi:8-amino-3,8-dideoxy-alpha-D-manno-octulosonate transaminase